MLKSLTVHPDRLETVRSAYRARYARQKDLAQDTKVSADTVNKFLNGKPVAREIFWNLCDLLELSWEEAIAPFSIPQAKESPDAATNQTFCTSLEEQVTLEPTNIPLKNLAFIGREQENTYLQHLSQQGYRCILLLAPGGVGKTTLAQHFLNAQFDTYIEFSIAKEQRNIASAASLVEEKLRQLGEEPGREFSISLERLKSKLKTQRIGVLIDNLEPALDGNGQLLEEYKDYIDLLRVLADPLLKSITIITSREPIYEGLDIHYMLLPSLKLEDWETFFSHSNLQSSTSVLAEIHQAYNGNALAMKVLCNAIKQYYSGNVLAYWADCKTEVNPVIETAVVNLIKAQFNRLQKVNLGAYNLLCRMGCYRYQDVPTVPLEGLFCLLWDRPEGRKKMVESLVRCSLIECKSNEYFLHPLIQEEAISRSKERKEWELINHKLAEFWTEHIKRIESIEDAIKAMEAFYHYKIINNYERAGYVLTKGRDNQWESGEALGRSLYRLGLLQEAIYSIEYIINNVVSHNYLCSLYNILGDLYWMTGDLYSALENHQKSGDLATRINKYNFQLHALFNLALCYLDLWDTSKALNYFLKALKFSEDYNFADNPYALYSYLAFLNAILGNQIEAQEYLQKSVSQFSQPYNSSKRSTIWCYGYGKLFLGLAYKSLDRYENALEIYFEVIAFSKKTNYLQLYAKALYSLSEINRKNRQFEKSLSNAIKAIGCLYKIGAKCDLAEAYLQCGLTYQAIGEIAKCWEYRDKAIQLFTEMQAPKQVERVKQSFEKEKS